MLIAQCLVILLHLCVIFTPKKKWIYPLHFVNHAATFSKIPISSENYITPHIRFLNISEANLIKSAVLCQETHSLQLITKCNTTDKTINIM